MGGDGSVSEGYDGPRAPSMGWDYSHVYNADNLENVRIICHQGRPVSSVGYQEMIKILDAPGLFEALGIEVQVERWGESWKVRANGQAVELSEGELVKLVFGPERRPEFAPGVFPIGFYQWQMDRV